MSQIFYIENPRKQRYFTHLVYILLALYFESLHIKMYSSMTVFISVERKGRSSSTRNLMFYNLNKSFLHLQKTCKAGRWQHTVPVYCGLSFSF